MCLFVSISTLHLIPLYPFMTLECDAPVLVKNINFYKKPTVSIAIWVLWEIQEDGK